MRKWFSFLVMMGLTAAVFAETTGRGGVYFGSKSLNHQDWGPLDTQAAWGINLDVKDTAWPVWISSGYLYSRDEHTITSPSLLSPSPSRTIEGKTSEFHLGVKKDFFPVKIMRLSVAGGPAYIFASLDNPVSPYNNDKDSNFGYWLGAEGIVFLGHVAVGLNYNFSQANVNLLDRPVDAGGSNLAFTIGFGW